MIGNPLLSPFSSRRLLAVGCFGDSEPSSSCCNVSQVPAPFPSFGKTVANSQGIPKGISSLSLSRISYLVKSKGQGSSPQGIGTPLTNDPSSEKFCKREEIDPNSDMNSMIEKVSSPTRYSPLTNPSNSSRHRRHRCSCPIGGKISTPTLFFLFLLCNRLSVPSQVRDVRISWTPRGKKNRTRRRLFWPADERSL